MFLQITVTFGFGRKLVFTGMKRYTTVGQLRELVAQELYLPSTDVTLRDGEKALVVNSMLLEDALDGTSLEMASHHTLQRGAHHTQARASPTSSCSISHCVNLHVHVRMLHVQAYMSSNSKPYAYSILWGMTVHSPVRCFFIWLVEWPWFDRTSLVLIVLNVICMMLSRPTATKANWLDYVFAWSDPIFSVLFTIEMLCKLLASGIVLTPHTYLRDGWNWIDAAVVISAWVTWEQPGVVQMFNASAVESSGGLGQALKPLRTVRVMRPLRTVTRVRGMRVVVQSLLRSLPEMASVAAIQLFIFVFFGIFGVQLFSGALRWRCVDEELAVEACARNYSAPPGSCVATSFSHECAARLESLGREGVPDSVGCLPIYATMSQLGDSDYITCDPTLNRMYNCVAGGICTYFTTNPNNNMTSFDHFPAAFVTIFYSMTLEGWVDTMYMLLKANRALSPVAVMYFLSLILLGSIFVFNLLLAVVFDNFSSINAESRQAAEAEQTHAAADDSPEARMPVHPASLKNLASNLGTESHKPRPSGVSFTAFVGYARPDSHRTLKTCVMSPKFEAFIILAITVNTCIMALDSTPPPFWITAEAMNSAQNIASAVFGVIFAVELCTKVCAFGLRGYLRNSMHIFDAFIVLTSVVEFVVLFLAGEHGHGRRLLSILQFCKGLRTLRLMRLMNLVAGMRKVVTTLTKSAEHILYLFMILVLFCIIFALLGMETIAVPMHGSSTRFTYKTIYRSMVNVFVVLSGENWNDLLVEAAAYVGPWSPMYYMLLLVGCNWILLNLFVAILLANINDLSMQEQAEKLRAARALLRRMTRRDISKRQKRSTQNRASVGNSPTESFEGKKASLASSPAPSGEHRQVHAGIDDDQQAASPPPSPPPIRLAVEHQTLAVDETSVAVHVSPKAESESLALCCLFVSCGTEREPRSAEDTSHARCFGRLLVLVENPIFTGSIQFLILLSSLVLVIELPGTLRMETRDAFMPASSVLELAFTVIFTLEALLKLGGYGAFGYFANSWNILDFVVVAISWPVIALPDEVLSQFAFLRALRSLRMLKLASLHEGMRVVIFSLWQSGPAIFNVMMVLFVFLVIFGILGMQLNAGRWGFCDVDLNEGDPYTSSARKFTVLNVSDCHTRYNGTWMNPHYGNFDNFFSSMLVLFETSTLERWPNVMLYMADAAWDQMRPPYVAPTPPESNDIYVFIMLYWVAWIFASAFVIMNLFVGVVVESFQRNKERSDGTIFLTERQAKWLLVMSVVSLRRAPKIVVAPREFPRKQVFFLVVRPSFEIFIMAMILASVVTMATTMYEGIMTDVHKDILWRLNLLFCVVFALECVLKQIGLGPRRYFRDGWNIFDLILVLFSVVDVLLDLLNLSSSFDPVFLRAFRLVRVGRLLRLIRSFKPMIRMIDTLTMSLPALVNVLCLLVLMLLIYAIAGVSLFNGIRPAGAMFLDYEHGGIVSFDNLAVASLTLFRCVTGESWNGIMHDFMINDIENPTQCSQATPPRQCGSPVLACIYFVTFTIFATFMLLNLLIGVILQNFSNTLNSGSVRSILPEQLDEFTKAWRYFDKRSTHQIPETKLPMLLHGLRVHAWVTGCGPDVPVSMKESILLTRRLQIPVRDGRVNYQETLQAIARAIHHDFDPKKLDELEELEKERFRPTDPNLLKTVTGASHEEVSRARARMRTLLAYMRKQSLLRTGQIKPDKRFKGKTTREMRTMAASVVQAHWRQQRMRRTAKRQHMERLKIRLQGMQESRVPLVTYHLAICFILSVKVQILHRRYDVIREKNDLDESLERIIKTVESLTEEEVEDGDEVQLDFFNRQGGQTKAPRPPMTTAFATMIIQSAWRALKHRRAFVHVRIGVRNWQARRRGTVARRDFLAARRSLLTIQAVLRFRSLAKKSDGTLSATTSREEVVLPSGGFYDMSMTMSCDVGPAGTLTHASEIEAEIAQTASEAFAFPRPGVPSPRQHVPLTSASTVPFDATAYSVQTLGNAC